jgi:hypothetical protein
MFDLDFAIEKAGPSAHAASPALGLTLAVKARSGAPVRGILLACQVRLEVARRTYDDAEADRLFELFGMRADWSRTQQSLLWAQPTLLVPEFERSVTVELPLACALDFELATGKYLLGLGQGVVPLLFLFSGTVFHATADDRLQASPISRSAECRFALPFEVYRATLAPFFADRAPIALDRSLLHRLARYKRKRGAPTIDLALAELLDQAEVRA